MKPKTKKPGRYRRHKRIRMRIKGTSDIPRLCVFKSLKHIYAQLIDDEKGFVLTGTSDKEIKEQKIVGKKQQTKIVREQKKLKGNEKEKIKEIKNPLSKKVFIAYEVGKLIAKKAQEKKVEKVVFDRGGYKYHGRIKSLADGAREGGLKF